MIHGPAPTLDLASIMQAIILGGNRRGATVPRCVERGEQIRNFKTFAPKAFAAIKADDWPRTQVSRSIVIHMQRARTDEPLEDFYSDFEEQEESEGRLLHDSLAAWAARGGTIAQLRAARPERLDELGRRAWESWVPLLAIADMAGTVWGKRGRDAAKVLSAQKADDADTDVELALLAAIRDVFFTENTDRLWTGPLLDRLNKLEEAPWRNWNKGEGLRPRELANKLRPYGVKSKQTRIGGKTRKGYVRDDFDDAFSRYLPLSGDSKRNMRNNGSSKPETGLSLSETPDECFAY
jgi:hypothetical protein